VTVPLDTDTQASVAAPESVLQGVEAKRIEGRSLSQIAWMRLKRDKVALFGLGVIIFLLLVAIFAPLLVKALGHPPNEFHSDRIDPNLGGPPIGRFGGIDRHYLLGVEPVTGRDIFSRIVYGARISLLIALLATLLAVIIGTFFGVVAGYFGGWVDSAISRVMDVLLAFPVLLFSIALPSVIEGRLHVSRITVLVFIIGFFSWPYIGRIIRGQALSLREREFVDAARSLGAGPGHILFKQLLPNLVAPILVYSTLIIPTNILYEAALSYLGVGVKIPQSSWGQMLSSAVTWYQTDPMYVAVPGLALFITVMAFNLFGDGLRDALDPRSSR
jgi:ABC-type dipeptide/oligopeptide/nickel transport system permease subunit